MAGQGLEIGLGRIYKHNKKYQENLYSQLMMESWKRARELTAFVQQTCRSSLGKQQNKTKSSSKTAREIILD